MRLFIAEKPGLGRAIAAALPTPHKKMEGCVQVGNGDMVSWCIGHLLEQAEPDVYNSEYKRWAIDSLPIVPDKWQLLPKSGTSKQLAILKKLIKQADQIVHCGDPDREGQLLVDEVIHYVGVSDRVKAGLQRCLISDLNLSAVRQSLASLKPNRDFVALSTSALARSRADWLYGINMTRAYTVQAQKVGYKGVVSIGRVQTPVLGLVVRRDREIEHFTPVNYYTVIAHVQAPDGVTFIAHWQPGEACAPCLDSEGRVLHKPLAENVVSRITDQPATVEKTANKRKKQAPPLPFSLSVLQIEAAKKCGLSAQQVLDTCQSLYETRKLITYPRSDNRYLPEAHFQQAQQVVAAIGHNSSLLPACHQADIRIRGKAWNDARVAAHHGIIPTLKTLKPGSLSSVEQQVYDLIARQYLCQFYPHWEYIDGSIELRIAGGKFVARARRTTVKGWKSLFEGSSREEKSAISGADDPDGNPLPEVSEGQVLHCLRGEVQEKVTRPPKPFDDATLLAAMTGISRYVTDPEIKKVLRETDGLGTEATRASIIELLFKRQFLQRRGKQIRATEAGRVLIESLPEAMSLPDMTAQWESALDKISIRQYRYADFMLPLQASLGQLVEVARRQPLVGLAGISVPSGNRKKVRKRRSKVKM
ncbi:MAG: DNA topoisomerase III [Gammaproteobacteria bacterium]|nr:MAG: DNA topoisomerase III [Pseudomonadota bacterium]PIE38444.1 MAG: DNA topoisomerase III [Gammaproteobacteria bacterium]